MSFPTVEYFHITDECLRQWNSGGNPEFRIINPVPALRFLYELCMAMLCGELPFQKCKAALGSVVFSDRVSDEEMASQLADIVTQMTLDITMSGEVRSRLMKMAKWLVESSLVPLRLFQERCEEDFLWESEMIKIKAEEFKSRTVRVNTRLMYQQKKFNLLREESEGYAKLVTLLCLDSGSRAHNVSSATIGIIKSLIGHFDLDPNRVFDIVLECFELQPDNKVFLDLIPIFPKAHASQILGFKFQYYQRIDVIDPVPFSLYRLTALLVKERFIDLDSIHAHLLPKYDEAFEHYNIFTAKRLDEANKIGKINLAATGKDLMDDEKQGDVTVDLYAAVNMENEAVVERTSELQNNQSLGLLYGFLSVDDWYHAHILLDRLSPLNPVAHDQICSSMFRLIEKSISSVYAVVHPTNPHHFRLSSSAIFLESMVKNSAAPKSALYLPKELFEMLSATGPYLYRDALLLQKVCRVLRGYFLCALELLEGGCGASNPEFSVVTDRNPRMHMREVRSRIEEALGMCLLPSLQLIPANPAAGQEIWEIMNLLPYEVRYRLYGEWERDDERVPMVLAARQIAKLDTRRILKRLAKENSKQLGRMIAKLAHANPMTVLRTIVHQIEAYKDMVIPVVDAFKYLTQLEYDVLEYVVIERLAQGGRERLKDDGLNLSDWLQSLASFWGHLCKKYPSVELKGLFQYLVNQLKKGNGIELVLLQELIQQMANVHYTENMTEEQLDAMAGSETLRCQATSFGISRNNRILIKSTNRLRDSLLPKEEQKLAIPLLLLIAQHHSMVLVNANAPYIKMVSEQYDRCHGTLLQFVEFLSSAVTPATAYAELLPSLDELVHRYHIDPEVAFLIYRPVLRLFRCPRSDVFWPLDDNDSSNKSMLQNESEPMDLSGSMLLELASSPKHVLRSQLLDTVRSMLPSKSWNSLSPDLYLTFWGLTLYDLYVPRSRYESEIGKLHAALKALEEVMDNSNSAITKRKKDKEMIQDSLDRLVDELQKHEHNVASVHRRLSREKDKWLSSCPDTLKINMEFLQRCIFPRCTFSMPDAIYCAMFVHTLHSIGTPFFNTVNHIDVLICKTLQPMICCCTEYEVGRLGRFLYETLKVAYHWKSDEFIYERECGNMPGFAVYYRHPNSQRVAYGQFIKVHWKWSQRITRLLIQCLESAEYMEIRNSLIMLTKIASVFPVTRKSGINLEKRVAKIKSDEREDLKVLATGVAAALAARRSSWVTEEEFVMGYVDIKPASAPPKPIVTTQNGSDMNINPGDHVGGRSSGLTSQHLDSGNSVKELRSKPADARLDRTESFSTPKSDQGNVKLKSGSLSNGVDVRSWDGSKQVDDFVSKIVDVNQPKIALKPLAESESTAAPLTRSLLPGPSPRNPKQEVSKDDHKLGKIVSRTTLETPSSSKDDCAEALPPRSSSFRHDNTVLRTGEKLQKRGSPAEDPDRLNKRSRKGEPEIRDGDDNEAHGLDRSKEKGNNNNNNERHERSYRERGENGDDVPEKSVERYRDERNKARYSETDKGQCDDRFRGQSLPPPPPLPPNVVLQCAGGRRDEDGDNNRRFGRHAPRLSPRHEDKERRRSEDNPLPPQADDTKRRRDDDSRDRKREERDGVLIKAEEREREREKANVMKEETEGGNAGGGPKRRKLKREHLGSVEPGEYSPATAGVAFERKGVVVQRSTYLDEPSLRIHSSKEAATKIPRRDNNDQLYEREWDDEKRKRRHRK